MKAQRPTGIRIALISCLAFSSVTLLFAPLASPGLAQQQLTDSEKSKSAAPAASAGEQQDGPVIVNSDLITMTVTVTDTYGRYVTGLHQNAFTVTDDKVPQEITFFSDD